MLPPRLLRAVHDAAHIALLPFSVLLVLGAFDPRFSALVERFDLVVHVGFCLLAVHSLKDWWNSRGTASAVPSEGLDRDLFQAVS